MWFLGLLQATVPGSSCPSETEVLSSGRPVKPPALQGLHGTIISHAKGSDTNALHRMLCSSKACVDPNAMLQVHTHPVRVRVHASTSACGLSANTAMTS